MLCVWLLPDSLEKNIPCYGKVGFSKLYIYIYTREGQVNDAAALKQMQIQESCGSVHHISSWPDKQGQQKNNCLLICWSNLIFPPPVCMKISSLYRLFYGECPQTPKIKNIYTNLYMSNLATLWLDVFVFSFKTFQPYLESGNTQHILYNRIKTTIR